MIRRLICLLAFVAIGTSLVNAEKIEFSSEDDLTITADVYFADEDDKGLPFICLFHQAGFSRGEYAEIAPRLVQMGFNCMAVDARSGKGVNGVENETAKRAAAAKKGQEYDHALPDIVASLQYARDNYAEGPLIAWGSSYSASLILKASAENEGLVDGTLSFAPNSTAVWTRDWIVDTSEMVKHPVFFTSAKREQGKWKRLMEAYPESQVTAFIPKTPGRHGSRALWKEQSDSEEYWGAVEDFLMSNFEPTPSTGAADGAATRTTATSATTRPTRGAASVRPRPEAAGGHGAERGGHGAAGHGAGQAEGHEEPAGHGKPKAHEESAGHGHGKPTEGAEPAGHGHGKPTEGEEPPGHGHGKPGN